MHDSPTHPSARFFSLCSLVIIQTLSAPAWAVGPDITDPRVIMKAVEDRASGDLMKGRLVINITDGNGRSRQRSVRSWSMDFDGGTRQLMIFESPSDVQNTGLLSVDYDGAKDDDQWLYLPSLHKATRISSGDKSGSFMGTDFTYSDMTQADIDAYDYKLIDAEVKVGDDPCWLIESRPRTEKEKKQTGYLKSRVWVSKNKLMPIRVKAWVREGKKLKFLKFEDIRQVSGIWTAHKVSAQTRRNKKVESTTVLQFTEMTYNNSDVKPDIFTQRRLEKGL